MDNIKYKNVSEALVQCSVEISALPNASHPARAIHPSSSSALQIYY